MPHAPSSREQEVSPDQVQGFYLGAAVAMAIGLLWLLFLRRRTNKIERLRQLGHKTSGVVVDHAYKTGGDRSSGPYPMVQFRGPDGGLVTARSDLGGSLVPEVGERVTVLFDPDRPKSVYIESRQSDLTFKILWVIGWIITGGAAVAVVVVLLLSRFLW
jgi:hypothetical protein